MVHIDDGFDFLGQHIRRRRKRGTTKLVVYTRPSRKAIQAIKDRISERTYRHTLNQSLGTLVASLNRMPAGWANHFRHGVSKKTFAAIDHHAWQRIARGLLRKHPTPRSQLRRFCDQGWIRGRGQDGTKPRQSAPGLLFIVDRHRRPRYAGPFPSFGS
ncbi:group II intron maturase-specific domain-containing protein [Nonomuraea phyllanthi]|uniref:group II intron maturase-specific domain-containing protein n=1 Tax=Nonomuraea phyllanthi TaxID=2219224 RepID=UPI001D011C6C|nr:group II intron maturase-specific domain-containing protein [Nonomuraea phyllanthi]